METFSTLLAICVGNSPVTGEFPAQRPLAWSFDSFFDRHPNKRLSKQWRGWWLEKPSCQLWRQCNGIWMSAKASHITKSIVSSTTFKAYNKDAIKALLTDPLWRESTGFLSQRASNVEHATMPLCYRMWLWPASSGIDIRALLQNNNLCLLRSMSCVCYSFPLHTIACGHS